MNIESGNLVIDSNNDQHFTKTNKQISPPLSSRSSRKRSSAPHYNGSDRYSDFFFFGACDANEFGDKPEFLCMLPEAFESVPYISLLREVAPGFLGGYRWIIAHIKCEKGSVKAKKRGASALAA